MAITIASALGLGGDMKAPVVRVIIELNCSGTTKYILKMYYDGRLRYQYDVDEYLVPSMTNAGQPDVSTHYNLHS